MPPPIISVGNGRGRGEGVLKRTLGDWNVAVGLLGELPPVFGVRASGC